MLQKRLLDSHAATVIHGRTNEKLTRSWSPGRLLLPFDRGTLVSNAMCIVAMVGAELPLEFLREELQVVLELYLAGKLGTKSKAGPLCTHTTKSIDLNEKHSNLKIQTLRSHDIAATLTMLVEEEDEPPSAARASAFKPEPSAAKPSTALASIDPFKCF